MKKVVLNFPDTASLFEFLVTARVTNTEIRSTELTALLTDQQILTAEITFEAHLTKVLAG